VKLKDETESKALVSVIFRPLTYPHQNTILPMSMYR
jgi:hypothetical protein